MNPLNLSEFGIIFIFIFFLFYSYKNKNTILLLSTAVYGFLLEQISIIQFHAYTYTNFLLFIFDIPLVVILGWSLILYSSVNLSKKLRINPLETALFASLIAINLEIIMEVIATNLGFWIWNIETQFFGVPYDSFFAWFVATFSFTYLLNKLYKKNKQIMLLVIIITSLLILVILDEIWTYIPSLYYKYIWWGIFSILMLKALTILKSVKRNNNIDIFLLSIPVIYIGYFFLLFLYFKLYTSLANFIYIIILFGLLEIILIFIPFSNNLGSFRNSMKNVIVKNS